MDAASSSSSSSLSLHEQLSKGKALLDGSSSSTIQETKGALVVLEGAAAAAAVTQTQKPMCKFSSAIQIFITLQNEIHAAALYSKNEGVDDIPTSSLPLLSVEYYLGKAYMQLPCVINGSKQRWGHVNKSIEFFHLFLSRCYAYESLLDDNVHRQYEALLAVHEHHVQQSDHNDSTATATATYDYKLSPQSRDDKLQNYQQTKAISTQISLFKSKLQQRSRLAISQDEIMDGYDHDGLLRLLYVQELNLHALDSLNDIYLNSAELSMLKMSMQREEQRDHETMYRHGQPHDHHHHQHPPPSSQGQRLQQLQNNKPMSLTHVTQDPITGQLQFKKESVRNSIFKPSWNQPTMTLDELAEKEVQEATQRSIQQQAAEEERKHQPRRYELLVRDGLEDDDRLVDASAKLDRDWDDWKDQNPRGSGNKMGDVGDRNF